MRMAKFAVFHLWMYLGGKMTNAPRQFFGFTYRYWRSIAALADVHI